MSDTLGLGLIGCGKIALRNHAPGLRWCAARLVAACDTVEANLTRAATDYGVAATFTDYRELLEHPGVDAVIIATPNHVHAPIAIAAAEAGKHVLCEKPLALDLAGAAHMLQAVEAAGVRHMTAFTYRFVPAVRYLAHLVHSGAVGRVHHFRARRFFDSPPGYLGWRQHRELAGTGLLGDYLSHRIDLGQWLCGEITEVCCDTRIFQSARGGQPADVDDWCALLVRFGEATGVLEATRYAPGHGAGIGSVDIIEVNGSELTVIYQMATPQQVLVGRTGVDGLEPVPVPDEFLTVPGTSRDPREGDPQQVFRYDQVHEFCAAIRAGRPCVPSFRDGVAAQAVIEAAVQADAERCWVPVPDPLTAG